MLGDVVEIETTVERVRRVRFTLTQRVLRSADGEELAKAKVMVACITTKGKLIEIPEELETALLNRMA